MRGDSDDGVGGLLNVLLLELGDEGSLNGSTTGGKLAGVDASGVCGRGHNFGGFGEDSLEVTGDLGGVRGTTSKDDLVDVKGVEFGLLHGLLDQVGELGEDLVGEEFVASAVHSESVINTISQGFDGEGSGSTNGEGLLDGLGLKLELGQRALVGLRVSLVLLLEVLGSVVDEDVVQLGTSELVVVCGCEDGVHAAARGNNSYVSAGSTNISNNNNFVLWCRVKVAGVVCKESSNGLVNELENLNSGILGRLVKSGLLCVGEVGRDGDDSGSHSVSKVVTGRLCKTAQVAGCDLVDGDSVSISTLLVVDTESDSLGILDRVGGCVGSGGIYRLEAAREGRC